MTKYWLGVVQRAHVRHGVELGIAQLGHGRKQGLQRLAPGDGFVYYSPRTDHPDGAPLREFTAIGVIADGEPWQADDGDFHPWRRRVDWDAAATAAPIAPLTDELDFSRDDRNWGYRLRRGLIELSGHDFAVIAGAMGVPGLERWSPGR